MATILKNTMTREEAEALAMEIERLETVLKQMKDRLKAFVESYGPLEAAGKVWDYYPVVSWEFTPEALESLAKALLVEGVNPWKFFRLSSDAQKELGWTDEVLEGFGGRKKVSRRFDAKKAR